MLKTIKTKKQMRLDELIKYIFDKDISERYFYSHDKSFYVNSSGNITSLNGFGIYDTFPVEIEEPITENTAIEGVQILYMNKSKTKLNVINYASKYTIEELFETHDDDFVFLQIYATINGKLELVWERDEE